MRGPGPRSSGSMDDSDEHQDYPNPPQDDSRRWVSEISVWGGGTED